MKDIPPINRRVINFIIKNRWIILASIFFVVWKFFLIGVLWDDRTVPPEPDDAYIYIGHINSAAQCDKILCDYPYISLKNYTGYTYLSYRIFFGLISKIFSIDPSAVFHMSFYLGTILLLPTLIYFLGSLTKNKNLIALSIFFLSLYNGSGAYHGFFWVVPSFFSVLLFMLIFSILMRNTKHWKLILLVLTPIFIYMHPSSIFSLSILIIFFINYSYLRKKIDRNIFKKIAFALLIASISYSLSSIFINKFSNENPLGIESITKSITEKKQPENLTTPTPTTTTAIDGKTLNSILNTKIVPNEKNIKSTKNNEIFPGLRSITRNYFRWIFPHYIFIIPFIVTIFLLIFYKEITLISLYSSLFLFVLLSSLHVYGSRSLVFIWPITFIFYSFGFWYSIKFINEQIKNKLMSGLLKTIAFASVAFFIIINILYSFLWNQYANKRNDIHIDKNFSEYLLSNGKEDDQIMYFEKILFSYSLSTPLINRVHTEIPGSAKYLITLDHQNNTSSQSVGIDEFYDIISRTLNRERKNIKPSLEKEIPVNFKLDKEFESIKIYINTLK